MNIDKLWYNERDLESACVVDFLRRHSDISTIIDVGCHASYSYAGKIRAAFPRGGPVKYTALDILFDDVIHAVADEYIPWNVMSDCLDGEHWDIVLCISSIEHSGITTYTVADYRLEQVEVFRRLYDFANKHLLVSFPYGAGGVVPGQYANITRQQLDAFLSCSGGDDVVSLNFWYNENSVGGGDWNQIGIEEAGLVPLHQDTMTRCVCVLEITKGKKK